MKSKYILVVLSVIAGLLGAEAAFAGSATVSWNANTEPDLSGYKIYYGTGQRTGTDPKVCGLCGYANSQSVGNVLSYIFNSLTDGQTYYFSVSAIDTSNNESVFSAQVSKVIAAPDTTAPTVPAGLAATVVSTSQISLSWTASTDPTVAGQTTSGVASYRVYRGGIQVGTSASASYNDSGLTVATLYTYTVAAVDAAGNSSAQSASASATTQSNPDTTAPTVSITTPSSGTASGIITFSAVASDPTVSGQVTSGLKSLTLLVDGSVFSSTSAGTISVPLDTTTLTNANHILSAQAQDNAGNNASSAFVTITVNNTPAQKYPRLVALTSLEAIPTLPANQALTATILSGATILETQSNLLPNVSGNYTVTFQPSNPQIVDIRITVAGYLSTKLISIDTTVNSSTALTVPLLLAGDFNTDNVVNSLDYSIINTHWLQNYSAADVNRDGLVNSLDYAVLKNNYNKVGQ